MTGTVDACDERNVGERQCILGVNWLDLVQEDNKRFIEGDDNYRSTVITKKKWPFKKDHSPIR
jgi:hypothetical protein